ncbi:MAG: hypothetical protein KDE55_19280 [Novosphingobium sp.]|nr:hypothetical protein [Novosphingobium sp.]
MSRITPVFRPTDYPGTPDDETRADVAALFEAAFAGADDPAFDKAHTGMAIAAQSPKFALKLSELTRCAALDMKWCSAHRDLMELAIQAVNQHFGCVFSFEARLPYAESTGIGMDRLAALPMWRDSSLFDEEQKLVLEYVNAVVTGKVPADVSERVIARYGERGAVEISALVGTFSLWAMLINTAAPSFAD